MTTPAKTGVTTLAELENLVIAGDFSKLTDDQCTQYIKMFCKSRGLSWESNPIRFLFLNGKKVPYAMKDLTDQLRRINGISVRIMSEKYESGLYTVHVEARDKTGRSDEDFGVVPIGEKTPPEFASNLKMKAITKAKRRVTLSISGLGWLDETEVEDIPAEAKLPPSVKTVKPDYLEPESGPSMTRDEARTFGEVLISAIRTEKDQETKETLLAKGHEQLQRMRRDQPKVYNQLWDDIGKEMAQHD